MATYKVIQDIEAEDKLVGPLSFRQFVYALIAAFCLYLSFIFISKHVQLLLLVSLPPAIFTGFLAFPFGKDQPTEVWALAKIRFILKPHKRIWDQSGVKELVTITAPKKVEVIRTNGLNQTEVNSRLHALANTIDSRGWAIKNVNVNLYQNPIQMTDDSDRLIDMSSMPQDVPDYDVQASDDILDERSNPIAQQMEQMINASTNAHRQHLVAEMNSTPMPATQQPAAQPTDNWFLQPPAATPPVVPAGQTTFAPAQAIVPGDTSQQVHVDPTQDEQALIDSIKSQNESQQVSYSHLRTIQPLGADIPAANPVQQIVQPPVADEPVVAPSYTQVQNPSPASTDPAILSLANNNDLNVATLAREANKPRIEPQMSQDEVVISLR